MLFIAGRLRNWYFMEYSVCEYHHCHGWDTMSRSQALVDCIRVSFNCTGEIRRQPQCHCNTWWRHQMETFSALLAIFAGNSPVPGEFPAQRPVARSFDVFFDLRLNKRLSKQSWGWWFETLWRPLWRHYNEPWWICVKDHIAFCLDKHFNHI